MQESKPIVTVGITCHSEGEWLLDCWESVLAQTDDRWEAVLVMDGTTHQRTKEVYDQLQHARLRKFTMPTNVGPYPTRNMAFEKTETPYHFYLDGDDRLPPDAVKMVIDTFSAHPETDIVYGDVQCFGKSEEVLKYPVKCSFDRLAERQVIPGPCAYRKALWRKLGEFAPELARGNGDWDFLIGAAEAGAIARHCGAILYFYRIGHPSITSSYGRSYHVTHEIIARRHPIFFADRKRRHRFLALGYRQAAEANAAAGSWKQAARLWALAVRYGIWRDRTFWSQSLRRLLPDPAYQRIRNGWRSRRKAR